MKVKNRWIYLAASTVNLMFMGLIYAWSLFRAPFGEMFPAWSISQLSLTFTISMIFFCLGGFAGGIMSRRISLKARMLIAAAVLFIGFFAASMVRIDAPGLSLAIIYIFYGVLGGTGVGIAYNSMLSSVNSWFPDKVGLASGIMLMGFGIGGLALGFIVDPMIAEIGVQSVFKALGVVTAIVCVLSAVIIKLPKADDKTLLGELALQSQSDLHNSNNSRESKEYTPVEMIRTSRFWVYLIWAILVDAAGLLVINSAADISVAFGGSAVLGMIVSLFNGAGRIYAGNNFDRRGRRISTIINNSFVLVSGLLLAAGALTKAYVFILLGLIFIGMAFGGGPTISSAYISRAFGAANFPTNFSIVNFSMIPAATIGPMVSSALMESSGGKYDTSFYAIIVFALAGYVCLWLLGRTEKPGE